MIDISAKIEKKERNEFPMEIFSPEIQDNFRFLAKEYSIPLGYLGTTALFAVSSLSGNMYTTELNGKIKNLVYALLVGQSGLGKSKPFELLIERIIGGRALELRKQFNIQYREWSEKKELSRKNKTTFTEPEPKWKIRVIQGGTMEGIMKHAEQSTAGFGIYYAEGKSMMGTPDAYKKENNSLDFWNKVWDGSMAYDVRAETSRERFVYNAAISVLGGMQLDRMPDYFTPDTIKSGLSSRFIITTSNLMTLNANVDHFSEKGKACDQWQTMIKRLFERGASDFFQDDKPILIKFTEASKTAYNDLSNRLIKESNLNRVTAKKGEVSELMVSYDSKLYQYVGRFLIIVAILDNFIDPSIDVKHVEWAEKLYRFYRAEAERVFSFISGQHETDLNETERELLEALPSEFTTAQAQEISAKLNLSPGYFHNVYRRKYSKGWIKKLPRTRWEKVLN